MNPQTLINRIEANLNDLIGENLMLDSVNQAISTINALIEPLDSFIDIVFSAGTTNIPSADTTIPSADTRIPSETGQFSTDVEYDTGKNLLKIIDTRITKILTVSKENLELIMTTVEKAKHIYSENAVAVVGLEIYFAESLVDIESDFQMKCKVAFPSITDISKDYDIPAFFDDLIYNLVIMNLSNNEKQKKDAESFIVAQLKVVGLKMNQWSEL